MAGDGRYIASTDANIVEFAIIGAGGEAGVAQCLEIIRKELDVTMAMCGVSDVRRVDANILAPTH